MIEWYLKVVRDNYANFEGRARRSEYWYFVLMNFLISIGFSILIMIANFFTYINALYSLAILIPSIAVGVRRLHDINKSGWYWLIIFIPLIGWIWLIILFATEGQYGPNQYGADPKNPHHEINDIGKPESF
mgnify:CR=1 FL=1